MIKKMKRKFEEWRKKMKKKYYFLRNLLVNSYCYFVYYHVKIDENMVYVESRDGKDFTGNIFRIVEELSRDEYRKLKIYVWAKKEKWPMIAELCENYKLKKLRLIASENKAVAVMEKSKYIISDSGVPWKYVKREGQIVLNVWHGAPLKTMGKEVKSERHILGTTQHFFFSSDYLLYPSEYMKEKILQSYMVNNVISGKALLAGYPRNCIFFNRERRDEIKRLLGYEDKKVFAYMPTHRGNNEQNKTIFIHLAEIDIYMQSDQIMLVKLHVFNQSKIDFTQFRHIEPFPDGYESYDVLNIADTLITDYSSVMFDYANTRNKIILFSYDKEDYLKNRGTFIPLSNLPFPQVKDVQSLIKEMNLPKNYDDTDFIKEFCTYDNPNATQLLCQHIFKNKKVCKEISLGNGKDNVLIYAGSLAKNGITTAIINLMKNIDLNERNYFLTFKRWEINADTSRMDIIPDNVNYLPLMCDQQYTFIERLCYDRYSNKKQKNDIYPKLLRRLFQRELERYFFGAKFSNIIQFDGYGKNMPLLFMECKVPKTIFVHNDMVQEIAKRPNLQHPWVLKEVYSNYDVVAVVSPDLIEPTIQAGALKNKIVVVNNIHDSHDIQERAMKAIEFEKDTELKTYHPGGIEGVLASTGKKFITVGRFSGEKGHQRLLHAFDKFCDMYSDTQLIIIGGHGALYNNTIKWARQIRHWRNVTIIKSMRNPMPVIKKCDLFILSSFYEGLGLVILEADCLGIPVFSTNIVGPKRFMEKYHGHLVENSKIGILQGMYDFVDGKVHLLDIDYDKYKQQALREFDSLFERSVK